ncbi:hypothetical protein FKM82_002677 [Ascaphus truei]
MPSNKSVSDYPITQFKNCRILRDHELHREDLWVRHGKILNPEKLFFDEKGSADVQVNCQGRIIAPGFIDTQINGMKRFVYTRQALYININILHTKARLFS